ncbi:PLP-dependent enzyme, glutamate decarboxylase [Frankia canadensis]|uniref:PLP-dependent enzyme, glutamate decarboxylase n=1 Tax=Frankia canadensis TaxID=1836972 RepID=A0A2I2KXE9_9ACTN|nr:pyridoxal-dependent decarboxylase [Frankia canadensis]SNQ50337.1 PLP-dependent enzyme, glutamate decarboxylase [Frankia canadensis]SOU57627.1 PLP-dependent enzyme, glutamate decarboxylase [Frankia canadensis]
MHQFDAETADLLRAVFDVTRLRLGFDPVPLDGPASPAELTARAGPTITPEGIGGRRALEIFDEVLARACISADHPRNLAFIPAAPTRAAVLFDLVVGASSIYGGSWMEGAGAIHAENEALRWLADLAGLPAEAGGVFVPGGTVGNLSALAAARHAARERLAAAGSPQPSRWRFVCGEEAHSSLYQAASVLDVDLVAVPSGVDGRLTGSRLAAALDAMAEAAPPRTGPPVGGGCGGNAFADGVFAVVATAGTTQFGIVDDLRGIVEVARGRGLWVHADGAYGLAALAAPSARPLFDGIAEVDSFIVDPHKWLFSPFDACALVYRDPAVARAAHSPQRAGYLDVLDSAANWNPSDYAIGLSRRARGLPFWFSLATHGTHAYANAVETTLATARSAAEQIAARPDLELVRPPQLSVVVFRRRGWDEVDYHRWSGSLLRAGFAFVPPTRHDGETVARFAIVNPRTTPGDIEAILTTMS